MEANDGDNVKPNDNEFGHLEVGYTTSLIVNTSDSGQDSDVPAFLKNEENSNPKQLPTRLLHLENVEGHTKESLARLFDGCDPVRDSLIYLRTGHVFFQTQAMAERAMRRFSERYGPDGEKYKIRYGQIVRTSRIWIGGLSPNITENDIKGALQDGRGMRIITWFRNPEEVEVYISYGNKTQAKEAIYRIRQDDFALRTSNPSLQVDFADLCCPPLKQKNCQTLAEIRHNCMTQIPTEIFAKSAKLYYIAGNCSIAEDMMKLEDLPLQITEMSDITLLNIESDIRDIGITNSIFLGIFEEQSENIVLCLNAPDKMGKRTTNTNKNGEQLLLYVFPSTSSLANHIMNIYFEDYALGDPRNKNFVIVIVKRK